MVSKETMGITAHRSEQHIAWKEGRLVCIIRNDW